MTIWLVIIRPPYPWPTCHRPPQWCHHWAFARLDESHAQGSRAPWIDLHLVDFGIFLMN